MAIFGEHERVIPYFDFYEKQSYNKILDSMIEDYIKKYLTRIREEEEYQDHVTDLIKCPGNIISKRLVPVESIPLAEALPLFIGQALHGQLGKVMLGSDMGEAGMTEYEATSHKLKNGRIIVGHIDVYGRRKTGTFYIPFEGKTTMSLERLDLTCILNKFSQSNVNTYEEFYGKSALRKIGETVKYVREMVPDLSSNDLEDLGFTEEYISKVASGEIVIPPEGPQPYHVEQILSYMALTESSVGYIIYFSKSWWNAYQMLRARLDARPNLEGIRIYEIIAGETQQKTAIKWLESRSVLMSPEIPAKTKKMTFMKDYLADVQKEPTSICRTCLYRKDCTAPKPLRKCHDKIKMPFTSIRRMKDMEALLNNVIVEWALDNDYKEKTMKMIFDCPRRNYITFATEEYTENGDVYEQRIVERLLYQIPQDAVIRFLDYSMFEILKDIVAVSGIPETAKYSGFTQPFYRIKKEMNLIDRESPLLLKGSERTAAVKRVVSLPRKRDLGLAALMAVTQKEPVVLLYFPRLWGSPKAFGNARMFLCNWTNDFWDKSVAKRTQIIQQFEESVKDRIQLAADNQYELSSRCRYCFPLVQGFCDEGYRYAKQQLERRMAQFSSSLLIKREKP